MTEIIYQQDLRKVLNVSRQTLLRWKKEEKLPKPDIHLTQKCVGWKVSTLREAGINV